MEKRVLLICEQKNFMVNAMIKNLGGEDYEVVQCTPDKESFEKVEDRPSVILVYLDDNAGRMKEFLQYLRDVIQASAGKLSMYLIGSDDEMMQAQSMIGTKSVVSGVFARPLNVKSLVENLNDSGSVSEQMDRKKHILVVDDDATMLRTLKLWLSDKYFVYMANSGMNAISVLKSNEVDLVLLDYEMPELSGPEVLRIIKDDPDISGTPVMFLTAKNDKESIASVMELNPEKYLLKTMPPDQLMGSIEEYFQ